MLCLVIAPLDTILELAVLGSVAQDAIDLVRVLILFLVLVGDVLLLLAVLLASFVFDVVLEDADVDWCSVWRLGGWIEEPYGVRVDYLRDTVRSLPLARQLVRASILRARR